MVLAMIARIITEIVNIKASGLPSHVFVIHKLLLVKLALLPLEQSPPLQVKSHMLTLQQRINTRQLALLSDDSPIVLS